MTVDQLLWVEFPIYKVLKTQNAWFLALAGNSYNNVLSDWDEKNDFWILLDTWKHVTIFVCVFGFQVQWDRN